MEAFSEALKRGTIPKDLVASYVVGGDIVNWFAA